MKMCSGLKCEAIYSIIFAFFGNVKNYLIMGNFNAISTAKFKRMNECVEMLGVFSGISFCLAFSFLPNRMNVQILF